MAYRPDASEFDRPLTPDELRQLHRRLSVLSPSHVCATYRDVCVRCRMDGEMLRRASAVQELVTAWKVLRRWKRRRPPLRT